MQKTSLALVFLLAAFILSAAVLNAPAATTSTAQDRCPEASVPPPGSIWVLEGRFSHEEERTIAVNRPVLVGSDTRNATINIYMSTSGIWTWENDTTYTIFLNMTCLKLDGLTSIVLRRLWCNLTEPEVGVLATTGEVSVEKCICYISGSEVYSEPYTATLNLTFTKPFNWTLMEEYPEAPIAYVEIKADFWLCYTGGEEAYEMPPQRMFFVKCVPPDYYSGRRLVMTFNLTDLDMAAGKATIEVVQNYTISGKKLIYKDTGEFNMTAFKPAFVKTMLEIPPYELFQYDCDSYKPKPYWFYWVPPPVLNVSWEEAGSGWRDYVDGLSKPYGTATATFTTENTTIGDREVTLVIFGLEYATDLGTISMSWTYDNETGALIGMSWSEDLTYQTSEETWTESLEINMAFVTATFEIGRKKAEVPKPLVVLKSVLLSAREVLVGRTVDLTVQLENKGNAEAKDVHVKWESDMFSGKKEEVISIGPGGNATVKFTLKAEKTGNATVSVYVVMGGKVIASDELAIAITESSSPTPAAAAVITSGAVASVVAAGVSAATAGISAGAVAPAVAPAPAAPAAGPPVEERPTFLSKVLSGIKYLLGRRKKRRVEPPRNSLAMNLGVVILSAVAATISLFLAEGSLRLASIPAAIYTSSVGFGLALAGLSLFVRRMKFYKDFNVEIDKREKAYLALTLILGLWGAASSAIGLLSVLVPYLASIPLAVSAVALTWYTAADVRSWA